MDCSWAEDRLTLYLLGTLDREDERALESHLDACDDCSRRFLGDGENLSRFVSSLPQMNAPERIKQDLFSRIESHQHPKIMSSLLDKFFSAHVFIKRGLVENAGKSAAALALVAITFSVVLYNVRLNESPTENAEVVSQPSPFDKELFQNRPVATAATVAVHNGAGSPRLGNIVSAEARLLDETNQSRRYLMYRMMQVSAPRAVSVKQLQGTDSSSRPRGMMFYSTSSEALLLALDLPPLPAHKVYQIWLIRGGARYSAGTFTVDSTGYGQAVIIPVAPMAEFEAIGITVEPTEGSQLPTGTSVLKGDL